MSHHKPDPDKNINLTIDGIPVTVPEGTRILEAARAVNIHIPTLCDHPDLCKRAVCRICVVECDGRRKLMAACANDVWEGANVVTHNDRIINARKTIIELLAADHPQECLSCIRSTNCELQTLAQEFGLRDASFAHNLLDRTMPQQESNTLVRDAGKCVKCGRCVEACQEVQNIRNINSSCRSIRYAISSPYGQALVDGSCVFCGHCAAVCPVAAIYEHDQSRETWKILVDHKHYTAVSIAPWLAAAFNDALDLPAGTLNPGKTVTALKRLGFDRVLNADNFYNAAADEEMNMLEQRIKNKGKLPLISGCSLGVIKFMKDSYPDLADLLSPCKRPLQLFAEEVKNLYPDTGGAHNQQLPHICSVAVAPCIAQKFKYRFADTCPDIILSVNELARIFTMSGIDFSDLPESPFDNSVQAPARAGLNCAEAGKGIQETEHAINGTAVKIITVHGFANARIILDSVRKGKCDAALIRIMSCPVKNSL